MEQTALLKIILQKADTIKNEYGSPQLYASHIAAAVSDLCQTPYTGFSPSDMTYHPARFEEERIRYLFSREVKLAAAFRIFLSRNRRNGIEEDAFDMAGCERIAALRNADILSTDVVFLCALGSLHPSYPQISRSVLHENQILDCLQDADNNIYDYVIDKIGQVCAALQKKADEAAAIRDWKPAEKFAEPEALSQSLFEKLETKVSGNVLTLKFPKFFGTICLKVSIHQVDGVYYIHDNGCAIRHLSKHVPDSEKSARILKKVCHSCWIEKGRITGKFADAYGFVYYLTMLCFVAHADLYYSRAESVLYSKERGYMFPKADRAEPLDAAALLDELKKTIQFSYDEKEGLSYWIKMTYCLYSTRASFRMETLPKGQLRISDRRKGKIEGEIFEAFFWNHDHLERHSKFIAKLASRFGAEFDGRNIYLTDKTEQFYKAIFKFFQLAVLLSEFGHDITAPKR